MEVNAEFCVRRNFVVGNLLAITSFALLFFSFALTRPWFLN